MNRKIVMLLLLPMLAIITMPNIPVAWAVTVPNPDKFTYLTVGGPETADGAWAYDTASAELVFNVYQCLLDFKDVELASYVAEIAESWPGYGVGGNIITPSPPHPHEYTNTSAVDPGSPVGSTWTRKGVSYTLTVASDGLVAGQTLTMTWVYNVTLDAKENLNYEIAKVELVGSTYKLTLTPLFVAETWYFKIRPGIKWQDPAYGTVTPYDCEYSFERGMVMDHSGGPQWMFFEPLTTRFGSRQWNIPTAKAWNASKPDQTSLLGRKIDDAIESNSTHVWFNLAMPYAPFQQILCQSWGSIMDADWVEAQGCWNASWHDTPGLEGYSCWWKFNNPPKPGPIGYKMMGSGPYKLDYIEPDGSMHRLKRFADYWAGWTKPFCSTIVHEVVMEWATRRARFLTDDPSTQADMVTVLRADVNDPDLLAAVAAGKVRYLPNLPSLVADAFFPCYYFDPTSPYMNYMGTGDGGVTWVANNTLLSDRDLRLALIYAFNATEFIQDVYMGEAVPLHDPIIYGIAYCNATKHEQLRYEKSMALLVQHLQNAWGGEVWNKGFRVSIVFGPDTSPRRTPAEMIKTVFEMELPDYLATHGISRPAGAVDQIDLYGQDWTTFITNLYSEVLGCYIVGWLADFPDPHNWVMPFMSIYGDFSYFQGIWNEEVHGGYGRGTMNWHPGGGYGQAGLPYYNYKGELVNDINNTYVEDLIHTGIGIVDPVEREQCYNELMDIFYAEAPTLMTYQPEGRHYERQWVFGWFYNSIYPGLMFYGEENLYKVDPDAYVKPNGIRDLSLHGYALKGTSWTIKLFVANPSFNPEQFRLTARVYVDGILRLQKDYVGWIPGKGDWSETDVIPFDGTLTYQIDLIIYNWKLVQGDPYTGDNYFNSTRPLPELPPPSPPPYPTVPGDLGGEYLLRPIFFRYDGVVNWIDLALFRQCFMDKGPGGY